MSRNYKMNDPDGLYFVSFATINWMDAFTRQIYFQILTDSLNYCINQKSMILYCYCLMPSHVHLIFRAGDGKPSKLLKEFKTHTSKTMRKAISENPKESRKKWMLKMMKEAGDKNSNVKNYQFWQQHNQPITLSNNEMIDRTVDYIHLNPVKTDFVREAHHWKNSSAGDYAGIKGEVEVSLVG